MLDEAGFVRKIIVHMQLGIGGLQIWDLHQQNPTLLECVVNSAQKRNRILFAYMLKHIEQRNQFEFLSMVPKPNHGVVNHQAIQTYGLTEFDCAARDIYSQ